MVNRTFNIWRNGERIKLERISKVKAHKLYNQGTVIYAFPCNANPESPWIEFCVIDKKYGYPFDNVVNSFEIYNCNNELGRYASFYIFA